MITALVGAIVGAFAIEVLLAPVSWSGVGRGVLVPTLPSSEATLLAVGIIGATVMPHVIYLHSALTQRRIVGVDEEARRRIFRFELIDVVIAMGIAGAINMAMLATSAAVFHTSGLQDVGDDLIVVADRARRTCTRTRARSSASHCSRRGSRRPRWGRWPGRS